MIFDFGLRHQNHDIMCDPPTDSLFKWPTLVQNFLWFLLLGKGGERQYNGLIDVYRKTLATDGIQGLYRGFVISAVGIFIYRGFYFGLYDSLKPILLPADAGFLASFTLGYSKYNSLSWRTVVQFWNGPRYRSNSVIFRATKRKSFDSEGLFQNCTKLLWRADL